jgi:hypothetical protein
MLYPPKKCAWDVESRPTRDSGGGRGTGRGRFVTRLLISKVCVKEAPKDLSAQRMGFFKRASVATTTHELAKQGLEVEWD